MIRWGMNEEVDGTIGSGGTVGGLFIGREGLHRGLFAGLRLLDVFVPRPGT